MLCVIQFLEYGLFLLALNAQWQIELDYNIFNEILWVSIVWFGCSTLSNACWVIGISPFWDK